MPDPKLAPCLWFNNNLGEALDFYKSVFKSFKLHTLDPGPDGTTPLVASFEIEGQFFRAINGDANAPKFNFNESVSMFITCKAEQTEVDYYWDALRADGGAALECGWLRDKFGLPWQVVPENLMKYMGDKDKDKRDRVRTAMLQMVKMDVKKLDDAYNGV